MMDQDLQHIIVFGSVVILCIVSFVTLILVSKLYFMFPREWSELPKRLTESQEKIVAAFAELSANNHQEHKLLEHLVNAVFGITEELNRLKNASKS